MFALLVLVIVFSASASAAEDGPFWRWECQRGFCQKQRVTPETKNTSMSLAACRVFCSDAAGLWPKPTGAVKLGNTLVHLNPEQIEVLEGRDESPIASLVKGAVERFKSGLVRPRKSRGMVEMGTTKKGMALEVQLVIKDKETRQLQRATSEAYSLNVTELDGKIRAVIEADTFFGGRHGLETLGQLIVYDDLRQELQLPRDVSLTDRPVYPHRGLLLDTARNFVSLAALKRTIDGMSASKLNTFHWHITDSHSFPYFSKSRPELSRLGAYSADKVYYPEDVAELLEFAAVRGVKIVPEFDAPAHVGEGWQDTDFVACFNKHPWQQFCVEPPCGQLDPTKEKLYDLLEDLYGDMLGQFHPDSFHMGGDEVSYSCWNSTETVTQWLADQGLGRAEDDFLALWDHFQSRALDRLDKQASSVLGAGVKLPITIWTSTLTKSKNVERYLDKDRYTIQVWTTGFDHEIYTLLRKGYKLILSNYDALYLDCGFAGWVTEGNNWCSPYIGWQKVYMNSPAKIAGEYKNQILGAEAALWTEQVDEQTVDSRLWPRAAAMAERLWAEPETSWLDAEQRMLAHRERLVHRGIAAEMLEPEWCLQNEANCPTNGEFNQQ